VGLQNAAATRHAAAAAGDGIGRIKPAVTGLRGRQG
jgi:hypothetical protein